MVAFSKRFNVPNITGGEMGKFLVFCRAIALEGFPSIKLGGDILRIIVDTA